MLFNKFTHNFGKTNTLYSAYSVLTLYKSQCSFVLPFESFAFMDVVILVFKTKQSFFHYCFIFSFSIHNNYEPLITCIIYIVTDIVREISFIEHSLHAQNCIRLNVSNLQKSLTYFLKCGSQFHSVQDLQNTCISLKAFL